MWGALGAWACALGVMYVTRTARAAIAPGDTVAAPGPVVRTMAGAEVPLLPSDSVVAVLAATSECAACRTGVPAYREIAARLKEQGVAFRVIVGSDSGAARQFGSLLPDPGTVVLDPRGKLLRSIGIQAVPTMYVVGRDGRLLRRWSPVPPDPQIAEAIASVPGAAR
jgi:thiol-disulfide isomerase/thioredoxin